MCSHDYIFDLSIYTVSTLRYVFFSLKSSGDTWFIKDETGKQLPAVTFFSESHRYLKQCFLEETKHVIQIGSGDIKWILTVPAIWSDPAKAFMRRAAVEVHVVLKFLACP